MMVRFLIPLVALLAAPALAQTTAPADAKPKQDPEKRICRAEVPTGSIMAGKRVCHTRAEWAAISKSNGQGVDTWRNSQTGVGMDGTGF